MDKFSLDFQKFWLMIENYENFTFTRYADGEVMLMKGEPVGEATQAYTVDKWNAPSNLTKVGIELLETIEHKEENYYYAISGINDNLNDYSYLKSKIKQKEDNITFVNLWINANYIKSLKKYASLKRDVILICNEKAKKENFPFNIKNITTFPNNCISFWEENGTDYINKLIEEYRNINNELFFISCGPVSEIIIHKLYENNPNNTYIDVGSSIDEFVHGQKTRPYMYNNTIFSKMISNF
jgi:hypothetical protein